MKFTVRLTEDAKKELGALDQVSQKKLFRSYQTIQEAGIEFVNRKQIKKGLFEIKTDNLRSLYGYKDGQIILVTVIFIKQTKKTPQNFIDQAVRRLNNYEEPK